MAGPVPSGDESSRTIVLVPARLASTRLPNKPLADIAGQPMIVHVWRRAVEAALGPVVVACAEAAIADAIGRAGGTAILTDPDLPSGTDRIFEALREVDAEGRFERIVNVQGDLPTLDPAAIRRVVLTLDRLGTDIATLASPTEDEEDRAASSVVKAIIAFRPGDPTLGRALYFTRAPSPWGPGPLYHHIGLYAFTRAALERYCALPPSPLEQREKLEQLRALENGMSIGVGLVDTVPFGVDTPADLERARLLLGHGQASPAHRAFP